MNEIMAAYFRLTWVEKLGLLGSVASIISLVPLFILFFKRVYLNAPKKVLKEFWFVFNSSLNFFLSGVVVFSLALYFSLTADSILVRILVASGFTASLFLLVSFFVR